MKNRNISDGLMAFAKENVKSPCHWGQMSQNMLFHSHGRIIEGVSALPDTRLQYNERDLLT